MQYAYTTYALGESAFSAGLTPPPGIYVSTVIGTYDGKLAGTADFGGVTINAGAKADIFTTALNLLYVPDRKFLGGNLGLSITVPSGWVDYRAGVEVQSQGFSRDASVRPVTFNLRYYHDYDFDNHFHGDTTFGSVTGSASDSTLRIDAQAEGVNEE